MSLRATPVSSIRWVRRADPTRRSIGALGVDITKELNY